MGAAQPQGQRRRLGPGLGRRPFLASAVIVHHARWRIKLAEKTKNYFKSIDKHKIIIHIKN
jgi:hypothetical protein